MTKGNAKRGDWPFERVVQTSPCEKCAGRRYSHREYP